MKLVYICCLICLLLPLSTLTEELKSLEDASPDDESYDLENKAEEEEEEDDEEVDETDEKIESNDVEGRFAIQEKLCALGLAACGPKIRLQPLLEHPNIEYVQPVKVVPDGPPIPAVSVHKKADLHDLYEAPISTYGPPRSSYDAPSSGYGVPKPTYNAPTSSYGAPKPSYDAPRPSYNAPKPTYDAPKPSYDAPRPTYNAPKPSYDAPKPSYEAPRPSYNAPKPSYDAPRPSYDAPRPSYDAPKPSYNAPRPSYDAPKPSYDAPRPSYDAPRPSYDAPRPSYDAPRPSYDAPKPSYNAPRPSYDAPRPSYDAPRPSYDAPRPTYNAPKPSYGAPSSSYDAPRQSYNAPSSSYSAPASGYEAPSSGYNPPHSSRYDLNDEFFESGEFDEDDDYHSGVKREGGHHGHHDHDHGHHQHQHHHPEGESGREPRRLDECYCVPSHQCPSESIMFFGTTSSNQGGFGQSGSNNFGQFNSGGSQSGFSQQLNSGFSQSNSGFDQVKSISNNDFISDGVRDYSSLIDPRTLPKDILASEDSDTLDLSEQLGDSKVERPKKNDEEIPSTNSSLVSRRRRDDSEEDFFPNAEARQFGPTGFKPPGCGGSSSGYVCCRVGIGSSGTTQFIPADPSRPHNGALQTFDDSSIRNPKSQGSSLQTQNAFNGFNQGSSNLINQQGSSNFNQQGSSNFNQQGSSSFNQQGLSNFNQGSSSNFNQQGASFNKGSSSVPGFGQCGKRNSQGVRGRIAANAFADGDADFGEYPWQVAILKKEQFDNVYVCGGSLVDIQHILTAAHCIRSYRPEDLRIRIGEWDVNNDSEFYNHVEYDVSEMFIHEDFFPGNLFNDIAVIRIRGFVDFEKNSHISPVCLPDKFTDFSGYRCQVTGWGKDAFSQGTYQHVLKEVEVPIINNGRCEAMLQQTRLGRDFALHPGFLCAGGEEGRDACSGDGGGPLVCEANGTWQLVGIVSWGVGCGQRDVPGVYVKVAAYESWIQRQLTRN